MNIYIKHFELITIRIEYVKHVNTRISYIPIEWVGILGLFWGINILNNVNT